jgi:hypothetical protein
MEGMIINQVKVADSSGAQILFLFTSPIHDSNV